MLHKLMKDINWDLLRTQKEWLLNNGDDEAMGLTHLLDAIQDAVVAEGIVTEEEVFGTVGETEEI